MRGPESSGSAGSLAGSEGTRVSRRQARRPNDRPARPRTLGVRIPDRVLIALEGPDLRRARCGSSRAVSGSEPDARVSRGVGGGRTRPKMIPIVGMGIFFGRFTRCLAPPRPGPSEADPHVEDGDPARDRRSPSSLHARSTGSAHDPSGARSSRDRRREAPRAPPERLEVAQAARPGARSAPTRDRVVQGPLLGRRWPREASEAAAPQLRRHSHATRGVIPAPTGSAPPLSRAVR